MKNIFISLFLILCSNFGLSQNSTQSKLVPSIAGPKGNYLYVVSLNDLDQLKKGDYFEIEITEQIEGREAKKNDISKAYKLECVKSYNDLKKYFPEEDLLEMRKSLGDLSERELVNKFINFDPEDNLIFYYGFIETKLALGHVFLDENVTPGTTYAYRISKKPSKKKNEEWGIAYTTAGSGNYTLNQLSPLWTEAVGRDSLVELTWRLKVDSSLFQKPEFSNNPTINSSYYTLPFYYTALRAKVQIANNESWIDGGTILPVIDEDEATLVFKYFKNTNPEVETKAFLILEDEVYNNGGRSDTALVYSVDSSTVTFINDIEVIDTLNGIYLEWEALPLKPFYAGIEIQRYNSDDQLDSIINLAPNATSYMDRDLELGQYFRYDVKALFVPQKGLVQKVAATGVGTFSKFTKPLPPFNLKGETLDNFIKLDWEHAQEETVYAYYIYRGTSPEQLELAAGPIKGLTFTDSLEALSGRTHYFYAVASQNYRQDTSAYSNVISIKPDKAIEMMEPGNVNVYFANGEIHLDWRDMRNGDNIIEGYVVERKVNNEPEYKAITSPFIKKASFIDKDVELGNTYYYRVACRSMYGDLSEFSDGTAYTAEKEKVMTINEFSVRNVSNGIQVSLPKITVDNRKAYNIYKKESTEKTYSKVISLNTKTFDFIDQDVNKDKLYVYYITLTETDNREGPKGKTKTIRRK